MSFSRNIWSYAFITVIAVLIWAWAAGETRDADIVSVRLHITANPMKWSVGPNDHVINVQLNGSQFALQKAKRVVSEPIEVKLGTHGIPAVDGSHSIVLADILNEVDALAQTGARVVNTDPATLEIHVDEFQRIEHVPVRPLLTGVQLDGAAVVDPPTVTVSLPGRLVPNSADQLHVEAEVERWRLETLDAGRPYSVPVKLRIPGDGDSQEMVRIEPEMARVTFTLRTRTRTLRLETVRVQIVSPPEDFEEYNVQIAEADRALRDVTISADAALIQQVETGASKVVAVVHLNTPDKEQHVTSRPVTYFIAVTQGEADRHGGVLVEAHVAGVEGPPLIHFTITERTLPAEDEATTAPETGP